MKTLYGVTYTQLMSLSPAELNDLHLSHIMKAFSELLAAQTLSEEEKRALRDSYQKHVTAIYDRNMDDKMYGLMRLIYDTEERFDLAVEMAARTQQVTVEIQIMLSEMTEEVIKRLEDKR